MQIKNQPLISFFKNIYQWLFIDDNTWRTHSSPCYKLVIGKPLRHLISISCNLHNLRLEKKNENTVQKNKFLLSGASNEWIYECICQANNMQFIGAKIASRKMQQRHRRLASHNIYVVVFYSQCRKNAGHLHRFVIN